MRAVDTNVVVRLLTRDDRKQLEAAERFIESGAWVSHLVLVEALWVLRSVYGAQRYAIATAVDMLLVHDRLVLQDEPAVKAALDRFRKHATVGFADCLTLENANKAGHAPFGTFDRALAKLDGAQLLQPG